tara:strand:+ start:1143 stop:2441 length:1299 start_codon:yes stop_codon:yes gene_type:complete
MRVGISDVLSKEKKKVLSNFSYLSLLQLFNYAVPVLLIPYFISVLGAEKYGVIIFSQITVFYFGLVLNYGLSLYSVNPIVEAKEDQFKLSEIFSCVFFIRLFLMIALIPCFELLFVLFDKYNDEYILHHITYLTLIEQVLFPFWFFQAKQKMKYITLAYGTGKFLTAILMFLLIKQTEDYVKVPMIYLISGLTSGLISFYILYSKFEVKLIIPNLESIIKPLKESFSLSVVHITNNFNRNSVSLVLGSMLTPDFLSVYSVSEKVVRSAQSLLQPLTQSIFPYIANKLTRGRTSAIIEINSFTKIYLIALVFISGIIFLSSDFISKVLIDDGTIIDAISYNIKIMSLALPFCELYSFLGIVGLINLGYKHHMMKINLSIAIISTSITYYLCMIFGVNSGSLSFLISEILAFILTVTLYFYISRKYLNIELVKK